MLRMPKVGVDLDQLETALVIGLDFLQQRADHLARAAPRRPEIDQYGNIHRCLDDFGFKIGGGDVDHCGYAGDDKGTD